MLTTIQDTINTCVATRKWLADAMNQVLCVQPFLSEVQFAAAIITQMQSNRDLHSEGWYAPPPAGVSALFSGSKNFDRLRYDNLRKQEYWPQDGWKLEAESAGFIYASPIHRLSGAIGDFGMTVYRGQNNDVRSHLASCLTVLEQAADYAQIGMEFRELHEFAQRSFANANLHNARTVTLTDSTGTNLGHTIPWSYEAPSAEEAKVISYGSLAPLRQLISSKRVHVNSIERFKIPANVAFTLEARLESSEEPTMPNTFYHLIVTFQDGTKRVCGNFNEVFASLGMDSFIKSKF